MLIYKSRAKRGRLQKKHCQNLQLSNFSGIVIQLKQLLINMQPANEIRGAVVNLANNDSTIYLRTKPFATLIDNLDQLFLNDE